MAGTCPCKLEVLGKLAVSFEKNKGQYNEQVKYVAKAGGNVVFFTQNAMIIALRCPQRSKEIVEPIKRMRHRAEAGIAQEKVACQYRYIKIQLEGTNAEAKVIGGEQLQGKHHYFIGDQKVTNVGLYKNINYQEIYPSIEWVHYGRGKELENDFILQPGIAPEQIRLSFKGIEKVETDEEGHLVLSGEIGTYRLLMPKVWVELEGVKKEVKGEYIINPDETVGFKIAAYDKRGILTIDPILEYSTFIGGNDNDVGWDIAVDNAGNAYIAGQTYSPDFPTTDDAYDTIFNGSSNAFITKLNASGTDLIYSTFLGGSGFDFATGIAVDTDQIAYVTGASGSADFPLVVPYSTDINNSVFVTKLNATGDALLYSTGLAAETFGDSIAIDDSRNMYIIGRTISTDLEAVILDAEHPAYQPNFSGFGADAFVTKFSDDGATVIYCTYLGGNGYDEGQGIAVDSSGNTYVTGFTFSTDFPIFSALYPMPLGNSDAFVGKFNAIGGAIYVTHLGGSGFDEGHGIAADNSGIAYIIGNTSSNDFPLVMPFDNVLAGITKAFISKMNADGSALLYSTYLGGNDSFTVGYDIALDSTNNMYLTGETDADDFPLQEPYQSIKSGKTDVFVTKLNAAGNALLFSTYFGGSGFETGFDVGYGIAVDSENNIYVTGETDSMNFPVLPGSYDTSFNGSYDAFVFKFSDFRPVKTDCCLPEEEVSIEGCNTHQEVILPVGGAYDITCEGRLLTVFANFRNVCASRELIVGVLVYEVVDGGLVSRGFRATSVMTPSPLNEGSHCEPLKVGPFEFVLPDQATSLCSKRDFKIRVIAQYGDALQDYNHYCTL